MINKLILINDKTSLSTFLKDNYEEVYDYFANQKYSILHKKTRDLQNIIAKYNRFFNQLDTNDLLILNFLNLLLEVCERYGLVSQFRLVYGTLKNKNYQVSSRTEAAALFFIDIKILEDYSNRLENIIKKLVYADEFEEDNSEKPTITLINYYLQVVKHFWEFNSEGVYNIKKTIQEYIFNAQPYSFLKSTLLAEILNYSIDNYDIFSKKVQTLLDEHFDLKVSPIYQDYKHPVFLIETGTDYAKALSKIEANFEEIRKLSFDFSLRDDNSEATFYSLKRGVAILENEQQLCRYMVGYSAMHKAKLLDALCKIDDNILTKVNHVVDWGCGQGMGSMVFCDYLKNKNLDFQNNKFTLVEPSTVALSRASLHLRKFTNLAEIITINKDLDSTNKEDFIIDKSVDTTFHIFSNILDVELFSLSHLTSLIESTFSGINIFICVSPYINELRTSRINSFMDNFEENLNFCLIASEDYNKREWLNDWTMIQRVFYIKLS
ncbi:hypothetical protein [Geminocystis herdmanii]|uniref:hypothetical protein n=1 Tax=Geminocystis herdmanii TaxID=669359 RepID=UPI00034AFA53|nr:hypothetical protein [Geminocystis herdmanii]